MPESTAARIRVLLIALALGFPAAANAAREIQWDDLLPEEMTALGEKSLELSQRLFTLEDGKRKDYQRVARQMALRDRLAGSTSASELSETDREIVEDDPMSRFPEAVAFWTQYRDVQERLNAANNAVSPALDGQQVRLPGYLLPLEFEGTKVREFLLVPYVGACIHTPPPPPNQIVFVQADSGYATGGGLYDPVWVEGTLSTEGGSQSLSLVDGSSDVDVGYNLRAIKVEAYLD